MPKKAGEIMAKSNFIVRGGADFSGIQQEISKTEKSLKGFESRINSTFKGISEGLGINLGKLTKVGLFAAAAKKLVDFGKASIDVAADMREVQNVVDVTFGSMAKDVDDFAANSIKAYGLSTLAAKRHASTMGAMLKSSGITGEAVRDMALDLTALAADMASFYNLDNEVAFQKIMSGMSGMTQPLKELGINMNIANVEAFALSQGFNKAWREMSQAEQTMWRYKYLLHVTKDAQGDFAREMGTWSNQVKILKMQWEEFMSLIGKVLVEILLPVVRFLNKALELLIKITKTIGKIYTMITGREIGASAEIVETNMDIEDSALGAADGQEKLADGIRKAAKAAKGALAPFDELNILQQNLASGGSGGTSGGLGNLFTPVKSEINTKIETRQVDDGIEEAKRKWEGFFIWLGDWWNRLKQAFAIPIYVPAPIFAAIPDPVYNPNWGLVPPIVPAPNFEPIPNPVYKPNWNLTPPPVPVVTIPPIYAKAYLLSLENLKLKTAESFNSKLENARVFLENLSINIRLSYAGIREATWLLLTELQSQIITAFGNIEASYTTHKEKIKVIAEEAAAGLRQTTTDLLLDLQTRFAATMEQIKTNISTTLGIIETNYKTHKENVVVLATAISAALVTNINKGITIVGNNYNIVIEAIQTSLQTFGQNVSAIAGAIATNFVKNLSEGFKTAYNNFIEFANSLGRGLKEFGSGLLKAAAETAKGFVSNLVNGFVTVWNNFKSLMASIGEKVSGWFNANKQVIVTTAIVGGITLAAIGLALAAPAIAPYVGAALGGLASIPALAKGGITNGPMLAIVGDNPGGKEVISPLDKLQDMLISAVGTALIQHEQFSSGNREPIVLQVNLDSREIARAIYDPLEDEKNRRGDPVITTI